MNTTEDNIIEIRELIRDLVQMAKDSNLIQWNEGLNFSDFIHALWRLFNSHESFKDGTAKILNTVPENLAIEILSQEIKGIKTDYR